MIDENRLIEELRKSNYHHASSSREEALLDRVIRIVKEQPKVNQWIPIEERLPEEHDSIFSKFFGTDKWNNSMWRLNSDDVNVTIKFEDGTKKTKTSHTNDGVWRIENESRINKCKVIAWQPLPKPYKGGCE